MKHLTIDGVSVVCPKEMTKKEAREYVEYIKEKYCKKQLLTLSIKIAEDGYVDLYSTFEKIPFERIRRITGYLVGTIERWNSAKQAEEKERVTHSTEIR